ncbi:NERD domain-containing protein [Nitrincola tibetensis]|uniref:NERD domain-containing protein n=1 Tax=Nitrincola tibetensis TaxID=2219697 RepID=A0A364NS97_9GAMM|nr:NERD domain-containing protein [Nitrincola tibetensis]
MLGHDEKVSASAVLCIAKRNPETIRWAIRYSGLFENQKSRLWQSLRKELTNQEWQEFFFVCDSLLEPIEYFDQQIDKAESELKSLSLIELLSYMSVLASDDIFEDESVSQSQHRWYVYDRIIKRKLSACTAKDFYLTDSILGKSLKKHLSPILFPTKSGSSGLCERKLYALAVLVAASSERLDYESSIDWFRFDPNCAYQMAPGEPVIYNVTDSGQKTWEQTEKKTNMLWLYWMNRATLAFMDSDLLFQQIGSAENHELNRFAYIKAIRSKIQLQTIYGLAEEVVVEDGKKVPLLQLMLASELISTFFQTDFIEALKEARAQTSTTVEALTLIAFNGAVMGENRFPMTWSTPLEKARKIKGWTVCDQYPKGNLDVALSILKFWTYDLKSFSSTSETHQGVTPRITERPFYRIGDFSFQFPWVNGQQNNLTAAVNNLRRLGARRSEVKTETRQVEQQLAISLQAKGFKVVVGYQPQVTEDDPGEVDLICYLDGVLLILEVKSGYIRSSKREVWLHKTNTIRKAAWQLARKQEAIKKAIKDDLTLAAGLQLDPSREHFNIHCWIVDTSIELDGQIIDDFLVVSREVMEVVLRDEKHLLSSVAYIDVATKESMFSNGFSPVKFVEHIVSGNIWSGLLEST